MCECLHLAAAADCLSYCCKKKYPPDLKLTEVVSTAEVEDVTAVDMMVQGFLDQVLGLITCQLCHPGEELIRFC